MMKALRREIWNAMLDSDMNSRYWGFMGARYSNWDMTVKIVLAITASTTVAAWGIWSQYPIWWKALSGLSAVLAAIQPVINLTKKAEAMAGLRQKWFQLKLDYHVLWLESSTNGANAAAHMNRFKNLRKTEAEVSGAEANLPRNDELLQRAYQEVLASAKGA
jgi:hypothetical protein